MKNTKSVLLILLTALLVNAHTLSATGKVENVRYTFYSNKYIITYDLSSDAEIILSVECGHTSKTHHRQTLYKLGKNENDFVEGDVGYVRAGRNKRIEWNIQSDGSFSVLDNPYIKGFEVISKDIFSPTKTILLGTFGYSFTPEQMSGGLLVGITSTKNGWGGFAHFRSNYNFGMTAEHTCDANGRIDGLSCFYTGEAQTLYIMANGGVLYNLLRNKRSKSMVALGLGAGYGQRNIYWQMDDNNWALNTDRSLKGVSAELSLIGSIRGFTLMAGVNTLNFKYVELEVGIGITF